MMETIATMQQQQQLDIHIYTQIVACRQHETKQKKWQIQRNREREANAATKQNFYFHFSNIQLLQLLLEQKFAFLSENLLVLLELKAGQLYTYHLLSSNCNCRFFHCLFIKIQRNNKIFLYSLNLIKVTVTIKSRFENPSKETNTKSN